MANTDHEEQKEELPCFIRHFTIITRVAAAAVIVGLWVCVFVTFNHHATDWRDFEYWHWYLLLESFLVTFIEIVMLPVACVCTHLCCGFLWEPMAEGWINSVTYTVLAIPNFIVGYNHVISYVAGILVAALAAVYSMKMLADCCKCCPGLWTPVLPGGKSKSVAEPTSSSPLKQSAAGTGNGPYTASSLP